MGNRTEHENRRRFLLISAGLLAGGCSYSSGKRLPLAYSKEEELLQRTDRKSQGEEENSVAVLNQHQQINSYTVHSFFVSSGK